MGTSKSYKATVSGQPQWGDLSRSITSSCTGQSVSEKKLGTIVRRFTDVAGGANRAGRGNSKIAGRSGARTAKKLGSFLGGFAASGENLRDALAETGLTDLSGKTVDDIVNHLIEYCSGPTSVVDDKAAKEATRKLLEEITEDVESIEELEEKLKSILDDDSMQDIIINYFGYYILEHLSTMFYEKLVADKGKTNCSNLFGQIKEFIRSRLREMDKTNPLDQIDWGSSAADTVIKNIQEDVFKVFEDEN